MHFKTDYVLTLSILTSNDVLCSFFRTIICVGDNSSGIFKGVPP